MRIDIQVPSDQLIWNPAIVVMPHPGELEVNLFNDNPDVHHAAILPSNSDKQYLTPRGRGYWFGCRVGNHVGRWAAR